jgi:hypothetical protein
MSCVFQNTVRGQSYVLRLPKYTGFLAVVWFVPSPPPPSRQQVLYLFFSLLVCRWLSSLTKEGAGGRSQIIRPREMPLYKSFNTLWEKTSKNVYGLNLPAQGICGSCVSFEAPSLLRFFWLVAHIGSEITHPSAQSAQIIISKTIPFPYLRPYCTVICHPSCPLIFQICSSEFTIG